MKFQREFYLCTAWIPATRFRECRLRGDDEQALKDEELFFIQLPVLFWGRR